METTEKFTTADVITRENIIMLSCEKTHAPEDRNAIEIDKEWSKSANWWRVIIAVALKDCDLCQHLASGKGMNDFPRPGEHTFLAHKNLKTYEVSYGMGSVHTTANGSPRRPTTKDIVSEALSSAMIFRDGMVTFEEFADEFGYDRDSRSAERTFKKVVEHVTHFRDMIGHGTLKKILETWEPD